MESILAALIGEAVTLAGVALSISCSLAVMRVKIDKLMEYAKKHNCLVECTCCQEQDMAVTCRDVEKLDERMGR